MHPESPPVLPARPCYVMTMELQKLTCFGKTDGPGSQTHAVFSAMATAKALGFEYVHTPFERMEHHADPAGWEAFMGFSKYIRARRGELCPFEYALWQSCEAGNTYFAPHFHNITESDPGLYFGRIVEQLRYDYFEGKASQPRDVIAVHVRRGDIMYASQDRIITDDEYLSTIGSVRTAMALPVHIYTDGTLEDMARFTERGYQIHSCESVYQTFQDLVLANVLIISVSSLSHCAGILNRGRVVKPITRATVGHKILDTWEVR